MHYQYVLVFSPQGSPEHQKQGPLIAWESPKSIRVKEVTPLEGGPKTHVVEGVRISKNLDTDFSLYVQGGFRQASLVITTRNAHLHPEWQHDVLAFSRQPGGEWVCAEDWPSCGNRAHEVIHEAVVNGGQGLDRIAEILTSLLHVPDEEVTA